MKSYISCRAHNRVWKTDAKHVELPPRRALNWRLALARQGVVRVLGVGTLHSRLTEKGPFAVLLQRCSFLARRLQRHILHRVEAAPVCELLEWGLALGWLHTRVVADFETKGACGRVVTEAVIASFLRREDDGHGLEESICDCIRENVVNLWEAKRLRAHVRLTKKAWMPSTP